MIHHIRNALNLRNVLSFLPVCLIAVLAACGGGGGGSSSGAGGGGGSVIAAGTFTKQFASAVVGTSNYPVADSLMDSKTQHLYYASEVGGSGKITKLRVQLAGLNPAPVTCPNVTVTMGYTGLAALTTNFVTNVNLGTPATVLNNATVTIPAGAANSWVDIPLATPFNYNGVNNLVVGFERTTKCSASVPMNVSMAATARRAWSDGADTAAGTPQFTAATATAADGVQNLMQFVFAGGDDVVTAADRAAAWMGQFAPAATGRSQFLILASDIKGSGPLTGIQFTAASGVPAGFTATTTITLSTVPAATTALMSNTFATNVGSNPTVVANNVTVALPKGTTQWWVPMTGTFNYDGTSNLLIDVQTTTLPVLGTFLAYESTFPATNRLLTSGAATPAGTLLARGLEPKLRFNGGTMDVNPAILAVENFPFNSASGAFQWLYLASELGTSGKISALTCRTTLAGVSTAAAENYRIVMSHNPASAVVATRAANLPAPVTVFNGTINVPAGLAAGDYFDVPLSTPFAYNGTDNVVIDISGTGPVSNFGCSVDNASAQYFNRRAWDAGMGPATTTLVPATGLPVMRFTISK